MLEKHIKAAGHECIFLPKFHCKLNPIKMVGDLKSKFLSNLTETCFQYWGWCKYHYQELTKATFAQAKECVREVLNACLKEVIQ